MENWLYAFSIAGVDVIDSAGSNVALATRGTGVTVSSTQHSLGQTREEHHWLWPLAADLGVKWIRIGYHDDPVNWHWVEKEKGKLAVDPEADAAIDYLVERGVDIVLGAGVRQPPVHATRIQPASCRSCGSGITRTRARRPRPPRSRPGRATCASWPASTATG